MSQGKFAATRDSMLQQKVQLVTRSKKDFGRDMERGCCDTNFNFSNTRQHNSVTTKKICYYNKSMLLGESLS